MNRNTTARILGAALLLLLAVSSVSATEVNYTSDDTFTVPAGVTQITVELWGAGGGSGAGDKDGPTNLGGGGGAGGQYAQSNITVTGGQEFNITVAAASTAATAGGDTTFWNGTGNLVVAKGGAAGTDAIAPSAGTGGLGSTTSGVGDPVVAGGDGADGIVGGNGGGGGGGAGSGGAGGSATGATAGTGTANNVGGDGGAGSAGAGNAGNLAGGGGGGASGNNQAGAGGGAGYARITYSAPPAAPTGVSATDGSQTDRVTVTWTKSSGATGYHVYTSEDGLIASLGDVASYDHTSAPAGSITAGTASATDGTNRDNVTLSLASESTSNGATRTYYVVAENSAGNSSDSATDTGYRGVGSLTYQWQRSAADSDASYSNIGGATTDPYTDTGAPQTGEGRYYRAVLSATGATQQTSSVDRGYVNVTPFFSTFDGATTDFSAEGDLSAVSQPILEVTSFGRIQWYGTVDVRDEDFDTYVSIADNSIDVDSANLDTSLNSRTEIRFYGLPYASEPVIFKDGDLCASPACNVTSYSAGTLIANVSGFSEYTTADYTATPNQTWTVTAWVNIDDTGGTQYLVEGINLGLKLVNASSDRMLMHLNSGAHEWTAYTAPGLLADQGWKHVAFVFRADDDYRRIYVNGVNETILGANVDNTALGLSSQFEIGSNVSGVLDEVMIFDRALAESEIDAIYRAGLYPYRVNLSSLAEGNYTFVGYAVDEAGNYENTSERTVTVSTSLDCQTISSSGTYTLTQNVSSAGTCFDVQSDNVLVDCAGYSINYSQSASGHAFTSPVSTGYDNVTIKNCVIVQGSTSSDSDAIVTSGDNLDYWTDLTFENLTIVTSGNLTDAINLYFVNRTVLQDVTISQSADASGGNDFLNGITMQGVTRTNLTNINISSTGVVGNGIRWQSAASDTNRLENVSINVSGSNSDGLSFFGVDVTDITIINTSVVASSDAYIADSGTNNITVINSTIDGAQDDLDIRSSVGGENHYFINTDLVNEAVSFSAGSTGTIHRAWYIDLYTNDTSGSPIVANINYTDSGTASGANPTASDTSLSTDGTGYYRSLVLYEYSQNETNTYYHTNYSFNLSNSSYVPLVDASRNFSTNTQLNFTMTEVFDCQTISSSGTYTLTQNVSSAGTCFNITVSDVALDCAGYTINYSQSSTGHAVLVQQGLDNLSIAGCSIVQANAIGASGDLRHAIFIDGNAGGNGVVDVTINDTNITTYGDYAKGIEGQYLFNSTWNTLQITTSGAHARGLDLLQSHNNRIEAADVSTTGTAAYALIMSPGSDNTTLIDTTLSATSFDLYFNHNNAAATLNAINTSISDWQFQSSDDGILNRAWYVDLYVNDTSSNPVVANINYTDSGTASSLNPTSTDTGLTTDASGFYQNLILYEYSENSTQRYYHTNYTFNVTNSSYVPLTDESRNFTTNTQLNFTLFSDSGPPTWSNNRTNATAEYPRMNDSVRFNLTMNDDTALDDFIFSWNGTGSWENDSSVGMAAALEYNMSLTKDVDQPKGTLIAWRVYFNDSAGNTNITDTFTFTVKNTAPPVPQLDYPADNESFLTNRTPRYNWTQGADVDGDPITYRWYLALDESFTSMAGSNTSVLNEYYDQQSALDFTTYWWRVAACDSEDCSANSTAFNFTVTSLVSIDIYNATPDFGNMSLGDTNDTTNGDPAPITVRNTGNIEANVSMNASALWDSVGLDTDYYQVKIRQAEIGAYSLANLTYVNLSSTPKSMIESLGWEDAADEALIDLRVQAPLDEYPGEKTSTIRVIAS